MCSPSCLLHINNYQQPPAPAWWSIFHGKSSLQVSLCFFAILEKRMGSKFRQQHESWSGGDRISWNPLPCIYVKSLNTVSLPCCWWMGFPHFYLPHFFSFTPSAFLQLISLLIHFANCHWWLLWLRRGFIKRLQQKFHRHTMKIRLYFSKLLLCLLYVTRMTLQLLCSTTIKLQFNAILPRRPMIVERKMIQAIKGGKKIKRSDIKSA